MPELSEDRRKKDGCRSKEEGKRGGEIKKIRGRSNESGEEERERKMRWKDGREEKERGC